LHRRPVPRLFKQAECAAVWTVAISTTGVNPDVKQIAAAVLRALGLAMAKCLGSLRSQADGSDLLCICTEHHQRALDHISSPLPQCEVVLGAAAFAAVPFNAKLEIRVLVEELGVRFYDFLVGSCDGVGVVRVVD